MYYRLASALAGAASWLQSVSQAIPMFQRPVMTWVIFIIPGCFDSLKVFNVPEQSNGLLSKTSLQ